MKRWFWNVLIAIDQFFNAIFGGDPDETISSRAGKQVKNSRFAYYLCRALHRIDPEHCQKSIEPDEGETQQEPPG